jgi:hypothetical protein
MQFYAFTQALAAISAGSFDAITTTFSCEDIPVSEAFTEEHKGVLCTACGSEVTAVITCGMGEMNTGAMTGSDFYNCAKCAEEPEDEDDREAEEKTEVPVAVWCPQVQAMDEVKEYCQEAVACMDASCGTCSPVIQEMLTCVTANIIGCEICALADHAGSDVLFEIA